ncbi:MAG: ABC transporter substrate-binding protein [Candidatus Dormibacteria bacterium]
MPGILGVAEVAASGVERAGFPAFFAQSYPRVLGIVAVTTGDRVAAEDATQEAFARALERWARVSEMASPERWVIRVAINQAIDEYRKRTPETELHSTRTSRFRGGSLLTGRRPGASAPRRRETTGMKSISAISVAILTGGLLAACGTPQGSSPGFSDNLTIVLNTASSKVPYVGKFTIQGATLAAERINKAGGVKVNGKTYGIRLEQMDNQLSPTVSLANVQRAISEKAVAIIDDGYTVDATFSAAKEAGLPILVDYDTNATLVDTDKRPNVFRIAPPDDALAEHLASYLEARKLKLALVTDDSDYGKDGANQLTAAFKKHGMAFDPTLVLPGNGTDYSAQALQVNAAGASGVVLWARASVIPGFVKALRQAGSTAAIFGGPNTEDPVVRSQLADQPQWVDGITYASFRITTEAGPESWGAFRKLYEDHNFNNGGPDFKVGVQASDHKDVVQPPDWQIFPYDMVNLVKAAVEKAGTVDPARGPIIDALNNVQVKSANGDNRGWTKDNHEGIVDDDIYFAVFQDMKFKPVLDDPLSKSLTPIDQE